jgi:pimeloyl-ACP methyl ester carboxylesterase
MVDTPKDWREETVKLDGADLIVVKGGAGRPLLVLHEELGHPGWLKWHATLAKSRTLLIPLHPGFGRTERAEWMMSVRDLAAFYARYLKEQGLAPIDVIGFSFGGWIAAEMAASNPSQFRKLILVAPVGIRPPRGEILDVFQMMAPQQLLATVLDPAATPEFKDLYGGAPSPEQFEAFEDARAQTARLAWTPYMFNPTLEHHLPVAAGLPTLIIWGKQDAVVPLSAGEAYRDAIPGARLVTFDRCGHRPEIERPADFMREIESFLS